MKRKKSRAEAEDGRGDGRRRQKVDKAAETFGVHRALRMYPRYETIPALTASRGLARCSVMKLRRIRGLRGPSSVKVLVILRALKHDTELQFNIRRHREDEDHRT